MTDETAYPPERAVDDPGVVGEGGPDTEDVRDEGGRRSRWWWIVVLLLLLALLACGIMQFLMPTARTTSGKSRSGLTPVFSVYGLTSPLGVGAGPDGEIAVANTGVQQALLFNPDGTFATRLGDEQPGSKVFSVDGVLFVGDTIYVCDWTMRRVWMFAFDGTVKGFFPEEPTAEEFGEYGLTPYDIAVFGDDFLVTSRDGIYRFDGASNEFAGRFDKGEPSGHALNFPNGIAVSGDGSTVYVCDTLNRRVVAYDASGNAVWRLGLPDSGGRLAGIFGLPRGVVVTERGVLVSDTLAHVLLLLDSDGTLLGTYGERGVADGQLNFPEGLDIAPDGLLYLADRENNRVQVLRLEDPVKADSTLEGKWRTSYEKY